MKKIINKQYYIFLCLLLHACFGKAMDQSTYREQAKRKLNDQTHQSNVEQTEKVNEILSSIKKNKNNEPIVGSPEVAALSNALNMTQFTPGDTKSNLASNIISSMVGHIQGSPVTKNNQLFDYYQSGSK